MGLLRRLPALGYCYHCPTHHWDVHLACLDSAAELPLLHPAEPLPRSRRPGSARLAAVALGPAAVLSPPEAEPEVNNEHQPGAEANELDEELEERPDCGSDSLLVHLSLTALK